MDMKQRSLALACILMTAAAPAAACDLDITVRGAKDGTIYAQVFGDAATFTKAIGGLVAFTLAPHGTTEIAIKSLPAGRYAVAAFEDRNGNGKLDKSLLGIPQEPYGFSRDATGTLGPPGFDQAAVECGKDPVAVTITLR